MHIHDWIGYSFLKILVFVICFIFYGYCILVFGLLHRVTDIPNFRFESKRTTNQIKIYR